MSGSRSWPGLRGRERECETLTAFVASAKAGPGRVLVMRGEAGIGKTALLDFVVEHAAGFRVVRAAAAESESALSYAGLDQLCRPFLDRADTLPGPQREALDTAFGLQPGLAPDRLRLGLALRTLVGEAAGEQPLLWVVDDAQWLDPASAEALAFVARRLPATPVALLVADRETNGESPPAGVPELVLRGLARGDAAALLRSVMPGRLDRRIRERVLDESRGNPLALLAVPRGPTTELTSGGAPGTAATPPVARLAQEFTRRLTPLPPQSRQLLLAAAAEPVGDATVLWRAAARLGIGADAAAPAEAAGLVDLGGRVRFRHPLARSAAYAAASPAERRQVHRALAEVTDPRLDPDLGAWHRAHATTAPSEAVAADLASAAHRAGANGGPAARAAVLEEAATLTPDPARRARRLLDAGRAKAVAGAFEDALSLLLAAEAGPLDEAGRACVDLLRGQVSYHSSDGDEAMPQLVAAARRFDTVDRGLAREASLCAMAASLRAGRLASRPGLGTRAIAASVRGTVPAQTPSRGDLLFAAMAARATDGYAASAPQVRRAVQALAREHPAVDEVFRSGGVATTLAVDLWDDESWDVLSRRYLDVVRQAGASSLLSLGLGDRALFEIHRGDLSAAASLVAESRWVAQSVGRERTRTSVPQAWLAAVRGHEEDAELLVQRAMTDALTRGHGVGVTLLLSARAVLCNGLGRYGDAVDAAREAATEPREPGPTKWALAELVEAGVRSKNTDVAVHAFGRLSAMTRASGTPLARGVEAARGALLREGDDAEHLYREAIERLGRTGMRVELARARLRYGEWLRREGRRVDARVPLRTAHETLTAMGLEAFAERARHELLATGETVRARTDGAHDALTSREALVARLAATGLTNPEIAAQLHLSPRTVEWHLRKVFTKTRISTRRQLRRSLRDAPTR
jgi:DNA-binding CsgD family transcriptional regulator